MGYADTDQIGTGLRQRIYCRAFIIGSPQNPDDRIVYLVLDTQSGDTAIRYGILEGLADLGDDFKVYNKDNVAVTGTHSHSGPGAWLNYLLPQITSMGFDHESYQAIVNGSVLAIQRAHQNLTPGHLGISLMDVDGININRSPFAYLANPADERKKYQSDVDKTMTVLRFERASDGAPIGMLSWFAVHGTSMYQNNTLVTGDNKGVAAYLFEEDMKDQNPNFVAGFSQSNVGDTSPNILGAFCEDSGLPCRFNDSTCGGKAEKCHGRGPFFQYHDQGTKSTFEIGRRQKLGAKTLFDNAMLTTYISDSTVSSFHFFTDMSNLTFSSPFDPSQTLSTCSAALGYGFAGGTTDGPGVFDFQQGTNDSDDSPALKNPLWVIARDFLHKPSDAQKICQHPKPILLDVGDVVKPYPWTPNIVDIQLLRVGNLLFIISPGEATTMSGRRWRDHITAAAQQPPLSIPHPYAVIGGPANTYAHYIATAEEYGVQRYEGASTLYGPHTLAAYINLTVSHLEYLLPGRSAHLAPGPAPPILTNKSLSFIQPVVYDNPPPFKSFGEALSSPNHTNPPGSTVTTTFVAANPRNDLRLESTYAAVEKLDPTSSTWHTVLTDRDWSLVFHWRRQSTILGTSEVDVVWETDVKTDGMYRMRYWGMAKRVGGKLEGFEGVGGEFLVGTTTTATEMEDGDGELVK